MNCCNDYGNCTQGQNCLVRKKQALQDVNLFWNVMEGLITLATIIGMIASLCFMFGYIWYRVTP